MITKNEEKYLAKIPSSKKVSIKPFDRQAKKAGELLVSKVKKALSRSKILFMGATALGIAGQNDIDIYVLSQNLEMNIRAALEKLKIRPDPLKDQFFLTDEAIIKKIADFADLNKNDVVLEVGAGTGNLTAEIAKRAGKVITFEIDKRFKSFLSKLPRNVELHYENAWNYVQCHGKHRQKKEYNKVVSNLPYSFIEPFLHNLTFLDYNKVILLVPHRFLKKTEKWGIFGSFFKLEVLLEVPKEKFYPTPKTNSIVIDLIKLPNPVKTKNPSLFLRQYMYQHEGQLVKNSLMEGIIKYAKLVHSKKVTKNEARKIIVESRVSKERLENHPDTPEIYQEVEKQFRENKFVFWS
ncbi:MAG: rRNA adenine N-6-methyltransferase family protein [Patescibacteria group bacterium]